MYGLFLFSRLLLRYLLLLGMRALGLTEARAILLYLAYLLAVAILLGSPGCVGVQGVGLEV